MQAYYRQALALYEMKQVIELLGKACAMDPENTEMQDMRATAIEEAKEDAHVPVPEEKERFEAMFTWMKEGGSLFDKLKLRYYAPDYRGVHAARNIKKGETILYVPKNEIITLEMAMESPIGKLMAARNFRNRLLSPKHSFLATYVMQERRKEQSFFDKYIDILPKAFDNFPIFYTQEERTWLEGSPFQNQISEKIKDIQADYNLITMEVPEYRQFSLKEYSEIRMMVASRIFGIQVDNLKTDGFVPYADMLNHKRPRQTSWTYSDERQGFIIEALEDIKRGEQVYDSYGKKCNTRFLLNYGFINLDNDANEFPLTVVMDENDPFAQQKGELIGGQLVHKTFRVQVNFEEPIMSRFLSFLRFVEFDENIALLYQIKGQWVSKRRPQPEDSDELEQPDNFTAEEVPTISRHNERKVWARIKGMAEEALSQYPNTLAEDLAILERTDLSFNQRNCVLFRSGEKEILHFLIELADFVLGLLEMKFKDAKRHTQSLPPQMDSVRDYLQNQCIKLLATENV